jgi:hypothetical protein
MARRSVAGRLENIVHALRRGADKTSFARLETSAVLFYVAWKTKDRTFPLSNELCARYGVSRWAKYRALARLKKAGMIATQRLGHQAMTVTLLTR